MNASSRPRSLVAPRHGARSWRRRLSVLGGAALLILQACSSGATVSPSSAGSSSGPAPSSAATAASGEKIVLTQWYHQYGEEGTQEAALRYAAEYTASHPNVEVKVEWVPGDYFQKLQAALLTDSGPDLYETTVAAPSAVEANQLADLSDILPADVKADFAPKSFDAFTVNDKIYAIPMVVDIGLMYYRKSLLDAAGVAVPQTFEEFVEAAKKLTSNNVKGAFLANDGGIGQAYVLVHAAGSDMVTDDTTIAYNNDKTVEAVKLLAELNTNGSLLLGAPTEWYDPTVLNSGLAAMQWGGLWMMPAVKEAIGDDFAIGPWPGVGADGTPSTFFSQWGQAVNGKSKQVQAAKDFANWLWLENTAAQQDFNLSYGFHLPPRLSAQASADVLKEGAAAEAVEILGKYGFVDSVYYSGAVSTPFVLAVSNIVKEGKDATSEISAAAAVAQEELDKLHSQ